MSDMKLIKTYKNFLHDYSLEQLRRIPEQWVWSIGQMYDRLIVVADEYLDIVGSCEKIGGEYLFNIGGFPPIKIKILDDTPPDNSKSKDDIMFELDHLMKRMKELDYESR
jgi:hypothetical protein